MSAAAAPPVSDRAGPVGPTTVCRLWLAATFSSPWISCLTLRRLLSPSSAAARRDGRHSAPWPQPARRRRPGPRASRLAGFRAFSARSRRCGVRSPQDDLHLGGRLRGLVDPPCDVARAHAALPPVLAGHSLDPDYRSLPTIR